MIPLGIVSIYLIWILLFCKIEDNQVEEANYFLQRVKRIIWSSSSFLLSKYLIDDRNQALKQPKEKKIRIINCF